MKHIKTFRLEHEKKIVSLNHTVGSFLMIIHLKGIITIIHLKEIKRLSKRDKVEMGGPPPMLTSEEVWNTIRNLPIVIDKPHIWVD